MAIRQSRLPGMMAVVQRVSQASVVVDGTTVGAIKRGLLVLLGIRQGDSTRNSEQLAAKILHLRIFPDETGKMNRSLLEEAAELLVVSQFTLYGDTSRGNRPSYSRAAPAAEAKELYEDFVERIKAAGVTVETGVFQAQMEVQLTNSGPVTLVCRSENDSEL